MRLRLRRLLPSLLIAAAALALYLCTLAPTVLWGDDAELQRLAAGVGDPGAGRGHFLWLWVARVFQAIPFGEPAWKASLVSAFFGAVTVGLVHRATGRLAGFGPGAFLGASALAVSHTFWLHSVRTEVYTLHTFFLALLIFYAVAWAKWPNRPWRAAVCGAILGLGLMNHLLMVTMVPAVVALVWPGREPALSNAEGAAGRSMGRRWKSGMAAAGGMAVGSVPWLVVTLALSQGEIFQRPMESFNPFLISGEQLAGMAGALLYQFPFSLPVAVCGWLALRRSRPEVGRFLLLGAGGVLLFAASFHVRDQYVFYLPAYPMVAVALGAGVQWLLDRDATVENKEHVPDGLRHHLPVAALGLVLVVLPVLLYAVTPGVLKAAGLGGSLSRQLPGRDASFFLWPPKTRYDGARRFVDGAHAVMPEGSTILADWTPGQALLYAREVEGARPDITVKTLGAGWGKQAPFLATAARSGPVFLAAVDGYYDMDEIRREFSVEPAGPVYRLRQR